MTESNESQMASVIDRLEEMGAELASMRRALFSLGSNIAGGPPGIKGYLAWHEDQVSKIPPPPPVWAPPTELRLDGPTLDEWVKAGYPAANYPPPGYAAIPPTAPAPGTTAAPGPSSSSEPSTSQSPPATVATAAGSISGPSSPPSMTSGSTQAASAGGTTGASGSK